MYTISVSIQIHVYSITHAYRECSDCSVHTTDTIIYTLHSVPIQRQYAHTVDGRAYVFCQNRRPPAISRITVDTRQAAYMLARSCSDPHLQVPTDILILPKKLSCRLHDASGITSSTNISETVIVRRVHTATQFVCIEFSFYPYNI